MILSIKGLMLDRRLDTCGMKADTCGTCFHMKADTCGMQADTCGMQAFILHVSSLRSSILQYKLGMASESRTCWEA